MIPFGGPPPPRPHLAFKRRLALAIFDSWKRQQALIHPLNYLLWECTLRCDLSCAHCGSDCRADSAVPDMPLADFLAVLRSIKARVDPATVSIGITGGEPSVREDLEECGAAIWEMGFSWGMVSNGWSLSPARLERLRPAGLGSLTISIDGLEASHDRLRGRKGSYTRAMEALSAAAAIPGLNLDVVTCVNQANLDELPALRAALMAEGLRSWRLFTIFPRGRAAGQDWLRLQPAQYRRLMEFISGSRREGGIAVQYACEGYLGPWEGRVRDGFFFCRAGINFASLLVDGSVTGCASMRRDFIQGNIHQTDFMDIWEKRFADMRDRRWTRVGHCAACASWRHCQGNGLHLWERDAEGRAIGPARCNLRELSF